MNVGERENMVSLLEGRECNSDSGLVCLEHGGVRSLIRGGTIQGVG